MRSPSAVVDVCRVEKLKAPGDVPWSLVPTDGGRLLQDRDRRVGLFLGGLHVARLARGLGLLDQTGRLVHIATGLGSRAAARRLNILTARSLRILTASGLRLLTTSGLRILTTSGLRILTTSGLRILTTSSLRVLTASGLRLLA